MMTDVFSVGVETFICLGGTHIVSVSKLVKLSKFDHQGLDNVICIDGSTTYDPDMYGISIMSVGDIKDCVLFDIEEDRDDYFIAVLETMATYGKGE